MGALAERRIAGDGTPESAWAHCHQLTQVPPTNFAALVPPGHRMVVVSPHPDDEVLGMGGLLTMANALERVIMLVAVTDGEASHVGSDLWPPAILGPVRAGERAAGLRALGLARVALVRLGIADGGVARAERSLQRRLLELLSPNDVVFATWQFDGHPDHEAVGRVAAHVCAQRGIRLYQVPVWMWHWASPADKRIPWDRLRTVPLDAAVVARKVRALAAHRTQLSADATTGREPIIPPSMLERVHRTWEAIVL